MKKSDKSKAMTKDTDSTDFEQNDSPDLETMMMQMMERLEVLEEKMDVVISQTSEMRQGGDRQRSQYGHLRERQHQGGRQNREFRQDRGQDRHERMLFQTICAECQQECEVPFKPTGDRPVYCKACFEARNGGDSPKGRHERRGHSPRDQFSKRKHFKFSKRPKR
jgi:CxxC-x17-CxxC domain-containing protein